MIIDYKVIGARIKETRRNKRITQEQIAEYLDISVSYTSRLERGVEKINLETLVKISALLEVSPSFLLDCAGTVEKDYLHNDLKEITKKYTPDKMKLLLKIAKDISEFENWPSQF